MDYVAATLIAQKLQNTGALDPGWIGDFRSCLGKLARGHEWNRDLFRLAHFVSLYLPLRYSTWARSKARNLESEATLQALHRETETALWTAGTGSEKSGVPAREQELVAWAFGNRRLNTFERDAVVQWDHGFRAVLARVRPHLASETRWSSWSCLALHFVSFFLDFACATEGRGNRASLSWSSCLRARGMPEDVISALEIWNGVDSILRDASGLPLLATRSTRTLGSRDGIEMLVLSDPI